MLVLRIRFPAGRYHATPWGHHVNEGQVEWPPSPWRLVRALLACGYATQGWSQAPDAARRMVEALAGTLPRYRLPAATVAHSRHYMPLGVIDEGREKTTLVFDAWADVGTGDVQVVWDVALDAEARALLETLAHALGYLGRSESWVVVDVGDERSAWFDAGAADDAFPHEDGRRLEPGWEQVTLIAPESAPDYLAWRARLVEEALSRLEVPKYPRKPPAKWIKERAKAEAPCPPDLVDALQRDTAWWKEHRWNHPPGSRRVLYWRRANSLAVTVPERERPPRVPPVEMMLLALTTPSGRMSALPLVTRTLPQAELLHRALVDRVGGGHRTDCPELIGRDVHRRPLVGHRHVHIVPIDLDGDERLDHVILLAPMGLGHSAQAAVRALRRTWTKGGVGELQLAVAGAGALEDLRSLPAPFAGAVTAFLAPSCGARDWTSRTPFVLPRHMKPRGRNTLEGQVLDELASRGLPAASVEVLPWTDATLRLRHAVRVRRSPASPPPVDVGFVLRLTFERPVHGPIVLGYGSHFGLGGFSATTP